MADIVLIFYACDSPKSILSIPKWKSEVSLETTAKIYVIGCKCDLGKDGDADLFISNLTGEGLSDLHDILRLTAEIEPVSLELTPSQRNCCYT